MLSQTCNSQKASRAELSSESFLCRLSIRKMRKSYLTDLEVQEETFLICVPENDIED